MEEITNAELEKQINELQYQIDSLNKTINNLQKYIDGNENSSDTRFGNKALLNNIGYGNNSAYGFKNCENNQTAFNNTGMGAYALQSNKKSINNVAIGYKAIRNCLGEYNTCIGAVSGLTLVNGEKNTLLGKGTDVSIKNGVNQIVIGQGAVGKKNNSVMLGDENIKEVFLSGKSNARLYCGRISVHNEKSEFEYTLPSRDGNNNHVLRTNGEGVVTWVRRGAININGLDDAKANLVDRNIFLGFDSGKNNTSSLTEGIRNVGLGVNSLKSNTTGDSNVALGHLSLETNTTGSKNLSLGYKSGYTLETGSNNIIIGYESDTSSASSNHEIIFGNNAVGHGNNIAVLGSSTLVYSITSLEPGITDHCDLGSSTYRYKKVFTNKLNINDLPTSSIGLDSGDIWSDSGTLKVKS